MIWLPRLAGIFKVTLLKMHTHFSFCRCGQQHVIQRMSLIYPNFASSPSLILKNIDIITGLHSQPLYPFRRGPKLGIGNLLRRLCQGNRYAILIQTNLHI